MFTAECKTGTSPFCLLTELYLIWIGFQTCYHMTSKGSSYFSYCIAIWAAFSVPVQSLKNQYFIVCKYFIWKYTAKKINACFLEGFKEHIGFKSHNFESKFNWTKLILLDLRGTREIQLPLKLSSVHLS